MTTQSLDQFIQTYPELAPRQADWEKTARPAVPITATLTKNIPRWHSKMGGKPYLPLNTDYPKNAHGDPLILLAQINFAEMPALPDYPKQGLLQFFIDARDTECMYGMNYKDIGNSANFRVIYYPEIIENNQKLVQDFSFLPDWNDQHTLTPFHTLSSYDDELKIQFHAVENQYLTWEDHTFWDKLPELAKHINRIYTIEKENNIYKDVCNVRDETMTTKGTHLGGYPYFTQFDPRPPVFNPFDPDNDSAPYQDYMLLFQSYTMTSEETNDDLVMWGDCGVATFFIHPDDLKKADFSKVAFYWDNN